MQFSVVLALLSLVSASPEWERGLKHLDAEEYQKAVDVFEPLCSSGALEGKNVGRCWGNVAEGYLHLRQYDKAIAFAGKAIRLGENSYSRLGAAYLGKKRYVDAINALEKANKSSDREFYGVQPDSKACILNNNMPACIRVCAWAPKTNTVLRNEACKMGRRSLQKRCFDNEEIAACNERCRLSVGKIKAVLLGSIVVLERGNACSMRDVLTSRRRTKRIEACGAGDVEKCELSCDDDRISSSCLKGKELRAVERSDRLLKCEARDEVACVTACEIDKNPAACSVLDTVRIQTIEKWKTRCATKDAEACDDLGVAYRDGKQGRTKDNNAAAEFFMKGCRLGREPACGSARAVATPKILVELEHRDCEAGNSNACRAEGAALIAAGQRNEGIALLDRLCADDVDSCIALGDATKDVDSSTASRAFGRACERGNGSACMTLFNGHYQGDWLPKDEGAGDDLYEDRCVDVDDDAPRIDTCSQMRSRIRNAERKVPGERGPQVLFFDYGFSAVVGADSNPYRTSRATVDDSLGEDTLGFGIYPHAVLALAPHGGVTLKLGSFQAHAGGGLSTQHLFGILSESSVSHGGPLNLLAGGGHLTAGLKFSTELVTLTLDDVASFNLMPGVQMPSALPPIGIGPAGSAPFWATTSIPVRLPYGGGVLGDVTLREENIAKARARLALGSLSADGRYRFQLTRVSLTRAIGGVGDLAALVAPARLTAPGAVPGQAGVLDEHRHHAGARVGYNVEELFDVDMTLYGDASVGFERYAVGDIVPANGRLGLAFRFEEFLLLDVSGGVGTIDLPSQSFVTWIGDLLVTANLDDDEETVTQVGLTRHLVGHPTIQYAVVNAGYAGYQMRVDEVEFSVNASLGVIDLGAATATVHTPTPRDGAIYANGKALLNIPVGFDRLAVRVGGEVEFLEEGVTALAPGVDVLAGNAIGFGRVGVFAGLTY